MKYVYLNGEILESQKAHVSILDRGFLFADGVYEVIPAFKGQFFKFEEHIVRLERSLNELSINPPKVDWLKSAQELMSRCDLTKGDFGLYIQITRGPMELRNHLFSNDLKPTVVMFLQKIKCPTKSELSKGFKAITVPDNRWSRCDIKSVSLLPNILNKRMAYEAGALESIMFKDGELTEGSASNVFIVKNGVIYTPPKSNKILGGITRDVVFATAQKNQVKCIEKVIVQEELFSADEVWVSSSTKNITPIVNIDGQTINNGQVGSLWEKMYDCFVEEIAHD